MNIIDLILIGISLSMDALASSICKGLTIKKDYKISFKVAIFFASFQALMPFLGYFLGAYFKNFIESIDHWIIFIILLILSIKMIKEAIFEKNDKNDKFDVINMIFLSISTSIDALAVGITFSILNVNLLLAGIIIGTITFILCFLGCYLASSLSSNSSRNYQLIGAIILFSIGIKILFEHLKIL